MTAEGIHGLLSFRWGLLVPDSGKNHQELPALDRKLVDWIPTAPCLLKFCKMYNVCKYMMYLIAYIYRVYNHRHQL